MDTAPMFLVWVNTDGTFVIGLIALGTYWASGWVPISFGGIQSNLWTAERRKQLAWVSLLWALMLPLSPHGTRVAANPVGVALLQPGVMADVQEWEPLTFGRSYGKYLVVLLLLFLVAVIAARPTFRPEEIGLLLLATLETFAHVRFVLFLC